MNVGDKVKIREQDKGFATYAGREGTVQKATTRDGKPYLGVELSGHGHLVWCFEDWLVPAE